MDNFFIQMKDELIKHNQVHLLDQYERLSTPEEKEKFVDSIKKINFDQIDYLYEKSEERPVFESSEIRPINYIDKYQLSKEDFNKYVEIGTQVIKEGKLAVATMAGGQGTRLGVEGPKGKFDIGLDSHKSIFEILTDTMKEAVEKFGTKINWYIMTSEENNDETVNFFEENNYFGYDKNYVKFFKQDYLPMLDKNGKILIDWNGQVKEAANGHGGIFQSMLENGIIQELKSKDIQWVFIGGVDNILVKPVDPLLVGVSIYKNVLAAGKSIIKENPYEKVGVFCKRGDKPSVIEYSEISPELAEEKNNKGELKLAESHILCNLFNTQAIEKICNTDLPYHIAVKKAKYLDEVGNKVNPESPNAYKFEAFLFDAFEKLDDVAILRVRREEEFAPIKNAVGEDSPETAKKLYIDFQNNNKYNVI